MAAEGLSVRAGGRLTLGRPCDHEAARAPPLPGRGEGSLRRAERLQLSLRSGTRAVVREWGATVPLLHGLEERRLGEHVADGGEREHGILEPRADLQR